MRHSKGAVKRAWKNLRPPPTIPTLKETFTAVKNALLDGSFHAAVKPRKSTVDDFFRR